MERKATIKEAQELFNYNFIGIDELSPFFKKMGFFNTSKEQISLPNLPYPIKELEIFAQNYILILGLSKIEQTELSIRLIRNKMGYNPDIFEPCFYNQDWYLKEDFIDNTLENKWYLIRKDVFEDSRSLQPTQLVEKGMNFPSAILCAYTFFAFYFYKNDILWKHDFVWCSDKDHNGDRIYVGKYSDIDGVNKNGFSVHRHLALRNCYGGIDMI